jgi:GTP pyrophosphokinase
MQLSDFVSFLEPYKQKLDVDLIIKSAQVAHDSHINQLRKSGEPYIIHPLRIACELLKYNFDTATICGALLHDVVEDTNTTQEEINQLFGEDITNLVMGVTKLSRLRFTNSKEEQLENFRKFILAFIGDIRVLIIKLFDRLDNMRTLQFVNPDKQIRIAKETLDIYVPLASRISLNEIKDELEDLCFGILESDIRQSIIVKIDSLKLNNKEKLAKTKQDIEKLLKDNNINNFTISGRTKKPYSIWKKMKKNNMSFEDIFDILAFRVVLHNVEDCYKVLYVLHTNYKAIFNRFKDYISNHKYNNYQSLHTCVLLEDNVKVEFQIRTEEMNSFAEYGIASHWNYKFPANSYDIAQYSWLQNLLTILNSDHQDMEDIYEYSKLTIFNNQIFVFTPKGEIINLPKESTALDFAYVIHSDIGNKCYEVYVNGLKQEPYVVLENGQKVEIITNENQEPQAMWLSFVKTGMAKVSIKRYLNQKNNKLITEQAIGIISYLFEQEGLQFYPEMISKIMDVCNIKSETRLFNNIVEGTINIKDVIFELYPKKIQKHRDMVNVKLDGGHKITKKVVLSRCCYPAYGDSIVGILLPNNSIEIHHSSCELIYSQWANSLKVLSANWSIEEDKLYLVKIRVKIVNTTGTFYKIAGVLAKKKINIKAIGSTEDNYDQNMVSIDMYIEVEDTDQLSKLISSLQKISIVYSAERQIN